jgi:hypothetical protein
MPSDRYDQGLPPRTASSLPRSSVNVRLAAALSRVENRASDRGVSIILHTKDSSIYGIGNTLVDFDREMRRTANYLETGAFKAVGTRGQLMLVSADESNSHDLVLMAVGFVEEVLLSRPVQFAIALDWFWEHRPWRRGIHVPAHPVALREVVDRVATTADRAIQQGRDVQFHISDSGTEFDVWFEATGPRRRDRSRNVHKD